ncbi:hypothetical protein [Aquibacillus saliphilus]|uniref:hypothetical protein n=1 Tax=Aquibacillus saliphilus TaxID=1909422 RepID=UPI001CEFF152|nr:hypothetical protein [Aquibacillus saliphilus]
MGYILPVQQYQYEQYHSRTVRTKHDPYPIENLHRAQLNTMYKNSKQPNVNTNSLYTPAAVHKSAEEKIFAEITGIGKNISEHV